MEKTSKTKKVTKTVELPNDKSIIINSNIVYRCGTKKFEKGPKCLNDLLLPNYGKMNKYVIENDKCYLLEVDENHPLTIDASEFKQYKKTETTIEIPTLEFTYENCWNYKTAKPKTEVIK